MIMVGYDKNINKKVSRKIKILIFLKFIEPAAQHPVASCRRQRANE